MKTRFLIFLAAMLLGSASVFAQSGNNEPVKGDVNGDGKVDVADITAVIKIMKDGGGTSEETKYYWYIGTTPITADNYQTLATQVSQYESEFMWTPTERAYVYALVTNDKIVQIIDPSFNVAVDTTVDTTSIKGYSIYKTATKIAVTPVKIKISPQTTYYYYAGWTLPTVSNVDNIINETYPTSSSDSTRHAAGKKTTSKSSFSLATVNLYNSLAKTNYYVLVPNGHAIYDTVFNQQMGDASFISQGTITVGNQSHTIYKSVDTTRNIGSIEIR